MCSFQLPVGFFFVCLSFWFISGKSLHYHFVVSCGATSPWVDMHLPPGAPRSEGPERATSLTTATVILWFFDQQKAQGKGKGVCITLKSHLIVKKWYKWGIDGEASEKWTEGSEA